MAGKAHGEGDLGYDGRTFSIDCVAGLSVNPDIGHRPVEVVKITGQELIKRRSIG